MATAQVVQHWLHYDSSSISGSTITTWAPRLGLWVGNAWEGTKNKTYITSFRAGNPNIKCYVYKDISSVRSGDPGPGSEYAGGLGANYSATNSAHPSYFLTRSGTQIQMSGFAGQYVMNVGLKAYQDAWATAVIADCQANGWDGVFADNCLYSLSQYSISPCDQYSSDSAFQAAYASFLKEVIPKFNTAGLGFIPNIAGIRVQPAAITSYRNAGMTGCFDEFWIDVSDSGGELPEYGSPSEGWVCQTNEMINSTTFSVAQPQSDTGGDDPQSFRYALASWFCCFNPSNTIAFGEMLDNYGPPPNFRTEYTYNLGSPTGAYTTPFTNVYRRNFTNGIAVVNANSSGTHTISLGASYLDLNGSTVSSIALAPLTGMVFRALGNTATPSAVQASVTLPTPQVVIGSPPSGTSYLNTYQDLYPVDATTGLSITILQPINCQTITVIPAIPIVVSPPGPPVPTTVVLNYVSHGSTNQNQNRPAIATQPNLPVKAKKGSLYTGDDTTNQF